LAGPEQAVLLLGQANLLADTGYDAQVIQTLRCVSPGHWYPPASGGYHKISFLACQSAECGL